MPRKAVLALVAPTLVLAHQLVFLARYGSIYGEALAHTGHGPAWSDAVAVVILGSIALGAGALVGLWRLARAMRAVGPTASVGVPPPRPTTAETLAWSDRGGVVRTWLGAAAMVTAVALVGLTVQENLEHLASGLDAPGVGILLSRDYPFAVAIVVGVGLAVTLVATLLMWRRAVFVERIRALAGWRSSMPAGSTQRPRFPEPAGSRPGATARQLGRRAPPVVLPA